MSAAWWLAAGMVVWLALVVLAWDRMLRRAERSCRWQRLGWPRRVDAWLMWDWNPHLCGVRGRRPSAARPRLVAARHRGGGGL